ncbi:NUDIX hydrolase, partial [Akkermansia sp.]
SWTYLFTGPSSPGLTTEMVSFYLADGLRQVAEGGGVDNEDITVHRIPLFLVHDWLMDQTGQGKVVDPKIFMGLYFLFRRFNGSDREEG